MHILGSPGEGRRTHENKIQRQSELTADTLLQKLQQETDEEGQEEKMKLKRAKCFKLSMAALSLRWKIDLAKFDPEAFHKKRLPEWQIYILDYLREL